jgi:acyl-CoA reductase-like NAD-dependent aldehyde dehydrogenase
VVVIISFETAEDEAVTRANNINCGMGAAVFIGNLEKAHRLPGNIEASMVLGR